jgi:hypothetical protein
MVKAVDLALRRPIDRLCGGDHCVWHQFHVQPLSDRAGIVRP